MSGAAGSSGTGAAIGSGGAAGSGAAAGAGGVTSGGTGGAGASGGGGSGGAQTGGAAGASGGAGAAGGAGSAGAAGTGAAGAAGSGGLPLLHVDGPAVKDPNGKTIVLRGFAVPDLGTLYSNAAQNASGITSRLDKVLAAGLSAHVVRFPVYPRSCTNAGGQPFYSPAPFPVGPMAPSGTHLALSQADYVSKVLKPAVDYALQKSLYVIIDYHQIDNSDGASGTDATTFWSFMAGQFASYSNVLYEPYNEPVDTMTTWANFKPRVQGWIDTIRASAPNNLIIVPSMSWDQHPGDAAASPPTGSNLMYTAHVYPGNWKAGFMTQVSTAVSIAPVFFSEWGYIQGGADKNLGTADATWGPNFQTVVDGDGASWTAWVADNGWTPNLFSNAGLTTLTAFGTQTSTWLQSKAASDWVQ
jgi:hypothetical protein